MCAISTHIYHTIQDVTDNSMSTDFFLKQPPQQMSWEAGAALNKYVKKRYPSMVSLPRWPLGQGSKEKNDSESRTVGFCLAKPEVAPDTRAGQRERGAFHNCSTGFLRISVH